MSTDHFAARIGRPLAVATLMAATLATLNTPSFAADTPPIKPGLWEVVNEGQKMNGQAMPDHSAQMAEVMKSMPPAARKQMEAQMKARGVQMAPAAGGGMAARMCLTADMLAQNRWQKSEANCKTEILSRSSNAWKWKVTCPQNQGEGTTTFSGSEAYTTQVHMTMVQDGRKQTMDMTHKAKWLGADCGSLKPVTGQMPPK